MAPDLQLPDDTSSSPLGKTLPLFVSVYIILLCFFLLLTSQSTADKARQDSLLRGLLLQFGPAANPMGVRIGTPGEEQTAERLEHWLREARLQLSPLLTEQPSPSFLGTRLVYRAPEHLFFHKNALTPAGEQLLTTLATLHKQASVDASLALTLSASESSSAFLTSSAPLLNSIGMPSHALTIALSPALSQDVEITIILKPKPGLKPKSGHTP